MKLKIIFLLASFFILTNLEAQRIKYSDIKHNYSQYEYYKYRGNYHHYSPWIAGGLAYIFPGGGHFYTGEVGRGLAIIGAETVGLGVSMVGLIKIMAVDPVTGQSMPYAGTYFFGGMALYTAVYVWSIFDAVKISKIKNMAIADRTVSMEILPRIQIDPGKTDGNTASLGMQLNFKF